MSENLLLQMLNGLLDVWRAEAAEITSTERGPIDYRAGIERCSRQLRHAMRAYLELDTMGQPAAPPQTESRE